MTRRQGHLEPIPSWLRRKRPGTDFKITVGALTNSAILDTAAGLCVTRAGPNFQKNLPGSHFVSGRGIYRNASERTNK